MSIYEPIKDNRRGLFALGLTVLIATGGIAGTYAAVSVETERVGNNISAGLTAGMEFTDESGVIVKDISVGEEAEEFAVTATNVGNISGHAFLKVKGVDATDFSDGYLDNTEVTITLRGHNNQENYATVSLRDFITNAYTFSATNGNSVILPGQNVNYTVRFTPASTAEDFTNADLGNLLKDFTLAFRFDSVDDEGHSLGKDYMIESGTLVDNGRGFDGLYTAPVADLPVVEEGVSIETD